MLGARVVVAVVVCALFSACEGQDSPSDSTESPSGSSTPAPGMDESLRDGALALIEAREAALVDGDRDAFLATVESGGEFARTQARWFDNLARLPVADLSLALGDEDVMTRVAGDGDLQLPVDFTMRLEGFDKHPVTQRLVYTMVGDGEDVVLASDRNLQIDAFTGWLPAPWDVTEIEVRRDGGILAVFDGETVGDADAVMADLVEAADVVGQRIPRWSGRFITYDISDLGAMDKMTSMEVDRTSGVAFPVLTGDGSDKVAGFRFMVNPTYVADDLSRSLVFRHELVHVALGLTDERSPLWLREGIAEYIARTVLPLDQRRRVYADQLLGVDPLRLEPSDRFYTRNPARNYPLAALVCDYLAATRGDRVLYDLAATMQKADFTMWVETEAIVRRELGLSTKELTGLALAWARSA